MSTAAATRLTVLATSAVLVALTASACAAGVTEGSSIKPAPQAAVTAASGGNTCAKPDVPAGLSTQHVMSDGMRRTVVVYYPHGHKPGKPMPMVIDLHGSGSTPLQQLAGSEIAATADKHGFVVVAPQAGIPFIAGKSHGFAWNVPGVPLMSGRPVPKGAPNDIQFMRDAIAAMNKALCVDTKRIYVTGFSGGARMASQVGCELSGQIAAVAPMSGLRMPGNCKLGRPESVLSFHGTSDGTNPYNGSKQIYWSYSVPVAAQRWAAADHCDKGVQKQVVNGVISTTYGNCDNGRQVVLYTVTGQRHMWPGTPDSMAKGYTVPKIDPNEIMWSFFESHPLDAATA
ncbi:PHB depolymerase family esterase [Kutzneria sp. NPDC051319]|uniref:alpha/beta hydrolase family esterase n=1 Tax=Kutzneria sp. NPDC051319 TaxID=3155047 RepID=UPI00343D30C5